VTSKKQFDSKEVGLEIGLVIFKYFLKSEYLHYGLFTDGLEGDIGNLAQAQVNYAEFLHSHVPDGIETILDVGCGSGKMAQTLIEHGYRVDCVSPSKLLAERARTLVGDDCEIFQCGFEDLQTEKRYDLVLFSESFQYIPVTTALDNALRFANPRGHLLVSDYFKTDAPGDCLLGGGHSFTEWERQLRDYPLEVVHEQDITEFTAPTVDVINSFSQELLHPVWKLAFALVDNKYPRVARFLRWKFRKKIAKLEKKHFTGGRTAEVFKQHKQYMFYLFRKR